MLKRNKIRKSVEVISMAVGLLFLVSSCHTITPSYNYQTLAKAAIQLGVDIDMQDNHKLYIEASKWIRTPHRMGGNTQIGVDCSGFTQHIYKKVYRKKIPRSAQQQYSKSYKISKSKLKEGDLVFFSSSRSRKRVNHVGVYLKDNLFIHTSSSQGVIVSSLKENYYRRNWIAGGRY